jgi:outer membrane phospholipase A
LVLILYLILFGSLSPVDARMQRILSVAPGTAAAGATVDVQLVWLNHGEKEGRAAVPERIRCTLTNGTRNFQGVLRIAATEEHGDRPIGPGQFLQVAYRLDLPDQIDGGTTLRLEDGAAAVFEAAAPAAPSTPAAAGKTPLPRAYFADNFYGYEPMYFLYGPEPRDARFQLSLKYRFLDLAEPAARQTGSLRGLFFGYTQTSLWDLESASRPFEDTSYMPELFYLQQDVPIAPAAGIHRLDFQTGIQHESNGQAGDDSRSLNIAYVRPTLVFGDPEEYHFSVSAKVWTYIGDLTDNPDIYRYRGYFDLHVDYGSFDGWKVASTWRKGTEGSNGSVQFDVTYPLNRIFFGNLDFFLYGQLFSGYGETLLNYDHCDTSFRVGLGVYR